MSSYLPIERAVSFKHRILETIKRKDAIFFEKILQQYQMKVPELNLGSEHKRTIFHAIAEYNFTDGMILIIEYINQRDPTRAYQTLNTQDLEGNTPAMICCLFKAPETLEILLSYDLVNLYTKNYGGKTALEIALDNCSPCATLLSSAGTSPSKGALKQLTNTADIMTPRNPANNSILGKSMKKDLKLLLSDTKDTNVPLVTVTCLTKESSDNLSKNTKLSSIFTELKENTHFIDQEFPHDIFSIIGQDSTGTFLVDPGTIKWLRTSEVARPDLRKNLIFETLELNDILKSNLAICDLYSALAAMVEFPQRLLNIFHC